MANDPVILPYVLITMYMMHGFYMLSILAVIFIHAFK